MSATQERDQAIRLAKTSATQALKKALAISDPWFRAQALAWIARFSPDAVKIAREAAKAALACDDPYQRTAVRAWEIAALAEAGFSKQAAQALKEALASSSQVTPTCSRAEALFLLAQAAAAIDDKQRDRVCDALVSSCGHDAHWRSKRALRDSRALRDGTQLARTFFG